MAGRGAGDRRARRRGRARNEPLDLRHAPGGGPGRAGDLPHLQDGADAGKGLDRPGGGARFRQRRGSLDLPDAPDHCRERAGDLPDLRHGPGAGRLGGRARRRGWAREGGDRQPGGPAAHERESRAGGAPRSRAHDPDRRQPRLRPGADGVGDDPLPGLRGAGARGRGRRAGAQGPAAVRGLRAAARADSAGAAGGAALRPRPGRCTRGGAPAGRAARRGGADPPRLLGREAGGGGGHRSRRRGAADADRRVAARRHRHAAAARPRRHGGEPRHGCHPRGRSLEPVAERRGLRGPACLARRGSDRERELRLPPGRDAAGAGALHRARGLAGDEDGQAGADGAEPGRPPPRRHVCHGAVRAARRARRAGCAGAGVDPLGDAGPGDCRPR